MIKQIQTLLLLLAFLTACTSGNQPRRLSTSSPIITPTALSTLTPSSAARNTPVTSSQVPSTPVAEPALVYFVSEPGQFEAWMPVSGSIIEHTVTRMLFGRSTECFIIFSRLNSAGAVVQYCDLPLEVISSLSNNTILDELHNSVAQDFLLSVDREQIEIVHRPYPEARLSGDVNMRGVGYDGTFEARIILVENRFYFVYMSVYHINWCNCLHQVDQVIDSFYVNRGLSIPFEPTP